MNNRLNHCARRILPGFVLTVAVALSLPASIANAQRPARRVGPEVAVGGITTAERIAQSTELRAELAAQLPDGTLDAPVRVELTAQDRATLTGQPMVNGDAPLRIGMTKPFSPAIEKSGAAAFSRDMPGTFLETADGGFTWAVMVSSPGAQAIRVRLEDVSLPPGTAIYFYNLNGAAHGPYVGQGRNGDGAFWTRSISSDSGILQLHVPGDVDRRTVSFTVSQLGHISGRARDRGTSDASRGHDTWPCAGNAACLVDANCMNGTPADSAKRAVAKMEWVQGGNIFTCTGGLLADTVATSQIPYFLTANHCISSSVGNLETWFDYATDMCNGVCPHNLFTGGAPPPSDTVGFTVLRTGSVGDFTLATLNQTPPAGAVFLGWNSTPVAFTSGAQLYRISNANFGPQVYSQHNVTTSGGTCGGVPRGAWIYSSDMAGATMGGSSGSPVVNSAGEVVGQLTGCCGGNCGNVCAGPPNNATIDGAFASYFNQVDDLLDPPPVCSTDLDCDDLDPCTTDVCVGGSCSNTPLVCPPNEICVAGGCVPVGACCSVQQCSTETAADCSLAGGSYLGDGTQCRNVTVYQSAPGMVIPDGGGPGSPAVDTIIVPDVFTVGDVDVDFSMTHTWVGDVTVTLTHLGTTVMVLDRPGVPIGQFGCDTDNYNAIILDDEGAGGSIEDACTADLSSPPNYTPNEPLSAFDGMTSAGDWVINVYDSATPDPGTLDSWSIHIDEAGSNPCIGVCLTDSDCDDGNVCTVDICNAGTCEFSSAAAGTVCSSGNVCTDDVCDGSGTCGVNNNNPCDDLVFCNGADTCSGGSCSVHAGDPCVGGAECSDTCDEAAGTCNTAGGTPCTEDGNLCTDNTCDGAGNCAATGNVDLCDDGDICTTGDVCQGDLAGTCAGTFADSDGDGVCDANDICPGGDDTIDSDGDGIPDACDIESPALAAPPHDILKNRYISIDPRGALGINAGKDFDIRLTLTGTLVAGVTAINSEWWANAPDAACISIVGPSRPAVPPNWDACPTLHLTGCSIIPKSTYAIVVADGGLLTDPPLVAATQAKPGVKCWGDLVGTFNGVTWSPPNGTVNIDDAVAAIKTFQDPNAINAVHVSICDLHPSLPPSHPNKLCNTNDTFSVILGFQGNEYPGPPIELCPDP